MTRERNSSPSHARRASLRAARPAPTRRALALSLVAIGLLAAGCAMRTPPNPPPREPAKEAAAPYRIHVGDTLEIRFYKTPELNAKLPVRSDGKISLELIGDVQAAGLEPEELSHTLDERYATELTNPHVTVIVQKFGGAVYVAGEVKTPSVVPLAAGMTALQAIEQAGGFLETARITNVVLARRLPDGQYKGHTLPLDRALTGDDLSIDVALQPSDILFVPRSRVANADLAVDQYIRKLLPFPPIFPTF